MRSRLFIASIVLFSLAVPVMLQASEPEYLMTITPRPLKHFKVPVTYYDYHIDGSNADFGFRVTSRWDRSGLQYANIKGWADTILTANKTPKRNPALTDKFFSISWNLEKLFTPWVPGVIDTFTWKTKSDTLYTDSVDDSGWTVYDTLTNTPLHSDTTITLFPDTIMMSDTMFKNIVIPDSFTFTWVPDSITYEDTLDSSWATGSRQKQYPINNKGFGQEMDDAENNGYTMTLHNKFTYRGGEKIYLGGDDDLYLFINGKLRIECGGFHSFTVDSVLLDSLKLTVGQKYDIDLFFVERRQGGDIYFSGIFDFENKGAVYIDTLYDTTYAEGISFHSKKDRSQKGPFCNLSIPPTSQNARLECFSVAGVKCADITMPISQVVENQSFGLSHGMYMIRVTFLGIQGNALSTGSFRKMVVRK